MNAYSTGEWTPEDLLREEATSAAAVNLQPLRYQPESISQVETRPKPNRKWYYLGGGAAVIVVMAISIAVPLAVRGVNDTEATGGNGNGTFLTSGGSGSIVVMDDGTTFTYTNEFGGDWVWDPAAPFQGGGRAQNWSKTVDEEWIWGRDIIRGVNLGGWLVTQPYITPSLYEEYVGRTQVDVVDEWSLSIAMGDDLPSKMERHYSTFITERDFAEIAGAGLNFVRIPIGYWAIETYPGEPFLPQVSWRYFLKAIQWGRKYGIRIYLDVHGLPGSQNGWDHSGRNGSINWMNGAMGIANAQRSLNYLRTFTQFISQEPYKAVVPIIGVANDVRLDMIGDAAVRSFYFAAYETIRRASGTGVGNGPFIAIHDGFRGVYEWEGFLQGADRLALDQHPFLAFNATFNDHILMVDTHSSRSNWAFATNRSMGYFGVTLGGQFSAAINDCGLWLNGIESFTRYPDCHVWNDWTVWPQETIDALRQGTLATMDALQNWFYWTWKIGNSTVLGNASVPMWDYRLGREHGWIPRDPRESIGHCEHVLRNSSRFNGGHPSTATGGAGAGTIISEQTLLYQFPPHGLGPRFSLTEQMSMVPTYTATGTPITLPGPTFTAAPDVDVGSGWYNPSDDSPAFVPVQGCIYPNPWNAVTQTLPATACSSPTSP
ncbi:hypothetical protein AX16_009968 [Volvariella volvacea WC 439]|nr:hypothetical protein AX16_009968 [Volvariella volvacea WC 439]